MSEQTESVDRFLTLENRHNGEILRMRRVRGVDGQTVLILEGSLPARMTGPPLHVHVDSRETMNVKAGILGVRIGQEKLEFSTGNTAVVPAGDLDRFIQAMFAVINASPSGRPSIFYLAQVLWRHRRTQTVALPPKAIQRIVFPLVLLIGKVLGKYRGTMWPGSPASCTGSPETATQVRSRGGEASDQLMTFAR